MASPQASSSKGPALSSLIRQAGQQAKATVEEQASSLSVQTGPRKPRIFNVLDYIEQSWGLGMRLYPVQRVIVKLYYHIPLEDKLKTIEVRDMFRTKVLYHFTEKEYVQYLHNEGRCNIGEQDHERRELLLSIGRRAGKCKNRASLVLTSKGMLELGELGDTDGPEWQPMEITVAQEGGRQAQSSHFYNNGVSETRKIRLASGISDESTPNHRIKVLSEDGSIQWRRMEEVKVGDFVAINRGTELWPTEEVSLPKSPLWDLPPTLNADVGLFLGYLVGDGTWGASSYLELTGLEAQVRRFSEISQRALGHPGRCFPATGSKNGWRWRFDGVGVGRNGPAASVRQILSNLGFPLNVEVDKKRIPWAIRRSPRHVVCAFLRGLFETDGSAEGGGRIVSFCTASPRMASEVQLLLLNLGIVSQVSPKWNAKYQRHYYQLSLRGSESRAKFCSFVGFDSARKQAPLEDKVTKQALRGDNKSDTESIPHQFNRLKALLALVPKRNARKGLPGWGRSLLREALGNSIKPMSSEDVTYPRLKRALDVAAQLGVPQEGLQHFQDLVQADYYFDPVVEVTSGECPVYDLTVPDGESFVANGLTNHNTTMSGIFASYEVYRLLNLEHPQGYYGLPSGNRIQIISVATDKDQASLLFNEVTTHLSRCEYFKPYIANNTLSHIQFRTPYDIKKYGETARHENGKFVSFNGKATMRVTFKSCVAKGLRGSGNIVIILDEMAHFQDKGNSSAEQIYNAVTPSALAFSPKDPADTTVPIGPVESRIICISSPLNKAGKFYELYHLAMSNGPGSANMLAIQAPTWEVNPTVEPEFLRQKYHADPATFMTEYGAQFSDRVRGWIEREVDLLDCIDPNRRPVEAGVPRMPHSMGIDLGLMNDGTAIFITHAEGDKIILDYYEHWVAGVDWRQTNPHLGANYSTDYARRIKDVDRLDFEEIANWIAQLTKRFYITDGIFDRWNGIPLEQALRKRGLSQFKSEFFTRDFASKIYQNAKLMMFDRKLVLFDWPRSETDAKSRHSPFIQELLSLQAEQSSKNMVVVSAPSQSSCHDDMSDAFVRSVWLSSERLSTVKYISGASQSPYGLTPGGMSLAHYHARKAKVHGAGDRVVPKRSGRGFRGR